MKETPYEAVKLTYSVAMVVLLLFVFFIIFIIIIYNRKQLLFIKEKQLAASEHENQLLQKELEKQKLLEQERQRISHDMHDDLGAGISALKLQTEFLKKKIQDPTVQEDINDLLNTAEDMNKSMREMLWSLNTKNDTLFNFVGYTSIYAENFFRKTSIKIRFENTLAQDREISFKTRRNLFLSVKEALNNIYKHSKADCVLIEFSLKGKLFSVIINDDGVGIGNIEKNGNGLDNTKARMTEIGGNMDLICDKKGTTIKLSMYC